MRTKSTLHDFSLVAILIVLLAMGGVAVSSCGSPMPSAYTAPEMPQDFSSMSWTAAFDALIRKMEREYAFTEWKGIDFQSIKEKYRPLIARAQSNEDFRSYYYALRDAVYSVPDGHVSMTGDDRGAMAAKIGGGFGIVAMKLDDGKSVIAARVDATGPAGQAGMVAGARVLRWGGKPVLQALAGTSVNFAKNSVATDENRDYQRLRFLVRAPVGSAREVSFTNPGQAQKTVTLVAVDDGMETLAFTDPGSLKGKPTTFVDSKMLDGNIGYVKVYGETDLPAEMEGDHTPTVEKFQSAMDRFMDAKAKGIVIDMRGNLGGTDSFIAEFLSNFYDRTTVYEYQQYYDAKTGKFEIWLMDAKTKADTGKPNKSLDITPGPRQYDGPVSVLVNTGTISSGEGTPMGIKQLPNGRVVGFWGTNGSFGMAGDKATMPGGLTVSFPFGRSLDREKVIQLDSRDGTGGVSPTNRIPMTYENALRWGAGEDVELEYGIQALSQPKGR